MYTKYNVIKSGILAATLLSLAACHKAEDVHVKP